MDGSPVKKLPTARDIADALTPKAMADALGVSKQQVSNELAKGDFPSSWFLVLEKMCEAAGQKCPRSLFRFKQGSDGAK